MTTTETARRLRVLADLLDHLPPLGGDPETLFFRDNRVVIQPAVQRDDWIAQIIAEMPSGVRPWRYTTATRRAEGNLISVELFWTARLGREHVESRIWAEIHDSTSRPASWFAARIEEIRSARAAGAAVSAA